MGYGKDPSTIYGCTNPAAINYNPDATVDDGSCITTSPPEVIYGCTDPTALNYNPKATGDDGSCTYTSAGEVYGCTDSTAANYNPKATVDDGSCQSIILTSEVYGCTDPTAANYNPKATVDDGSCQSIILTSEVYGCTDPTALNYNTDATVDDGSCTYQPEDDDTDNDNVLTGTVAMLSGNNNRIWTLTSYNNSGLFSYAQSGMIATVSNPSQNYFENKIIQEIDLTTAMITLTSGVSGAQYGDSLNFSLDTSQQVPDDEEDTVPQNPVVEVGMVATLEDGWYFASIQMEYLLPDLNNPYEGPYHLMEDGTYMTGEGVLNASHEINPNKIIIQSLETATVATITPEEEMPAVDYETIQDVREIVSDVFYKLWFEDYTLTDEQILSMQTTIRDGKKQTGRAEGEPLVFYKKDRNTLENRNDLQGEEFENICQDIFDNELPNDIIPDKFIIDELPEEPYTNTEEPEPPLNQYWILKKYIIRYTNAPTSYDVVIAEEVILYSEDATVSN